MAEICLRFDWIIEYIAQLPLKSLSDPADWVGTGCHGEVTGGQGVHNDPDCNIIHYSVLDKIYT